MQVLHFRVPSDLAAGYQLEEDFCSDVDPVQLSSPLWARLQLAQVQALILQPAPPRAHREVLQRRVLR